jgi:hypothetical protein
MSKGLTVYSKIGGAQDIMVDDIGNISNAQPAPTTPSRTAMMAVSARARPFLTDIRLAEMEFATTLVI